MGSNCRWVWERGGQFWKRGYSKRNRHKSQTFRKSNCATISSAKLLQDKGDQFTLQAGPLYQLQIIFMIHELWTHEGIVSHCNALWFAFYLSIFLLGQTIPTAQVCSYFFQKKVCIKPKWFGYYTEIIFSLFSGNLKDLMIGITTFLYSANEKINFP